MKKLVFPVILLSLLSGCGGISETPNTDKDINVVSGLAEGTTTDLLTYETGVTTDEATTSDATTTKTAGDKVQGSTTIAHTTNSVTMPVITRATGGNDGIVHGTTMSVPSVQRRTTTTSSTTTITTTVEPTTQSSTFDPRDYSNISYALGTKNNEIKVLRGNKAGEEKTVQVLNDADTSEIKEALEDDSTKKIEDFIVNADFDDDGFPDLFIVEKQDELNRLGKYYRYDKDKGIYTSWTEMNSLKNLIDLEELKKGSIIVYDKKDDNVEYESKTFEWNEEGALVLKSSIHQYTDEESGEIRIKYVYYDENGEETTSEIRNKEGEIVADGNQNPTEPTSDEEPSSENNYN
ncbi:hypothetical protein [Ruminococcus sp.]|uniref:hypothetical protein n=1 Tax=Ruminococcus sp. TaxID=41978 RepID=UPI001B539E25|nr:hypothetical protein [Ruminococcus sp.]MBP5430720.1 hypothetical protein [Ruminococcus sp.]